MHANTQARLTAFATLAWLLWACSDAVPVWKDQVRLDNLYLKYNQPCEFALNLERQKDTLTYRMDLELTYDPGINRTVLPVFLVFEDREHNLAEFSATIQLKENNRWVGEPQPNEVDYQLSQTIIPNLTLAPGKYNLRLYANDQDSAQIFGVVQVALRLFEVSEN